MRLETQFLKYGKGSSMNHIYLWLSSFFSLFLLLSSQSVCETKPSQVYTLGVVLPLTGEAASVGGFARRSIELAYSELPLEIQSKLRLIYEDDALDPKKAVAAFQMLSDTKEMDGVISVSSGIGHALAPLAERQKKLMMVLGASDKTFAVGKEYVFIHWVSPENEAAKMVEEIKRRDYKKIAIISHIQQGVEAYNEVLFNLLKKEGLFDRIVMHEAIPIGSNDLSSQLLKLRAAKPDGIFLALFSEGLATFSRKIKEMRITGDIFGAEFFEDEHVVKAAKGALLGAWYVNIDDASQEFVTKYRDKYNEFPGLTAANAYDSLNLIAKAVVLHGRDNKKISNFLRDLKDYNGASGSYSATGDNRFTLQAATKIVRESGFEKLR